MQLQLPEKIKIGVDKKLYIEKDIGPTGAPWFSATIEANAEDLSSDLIAGPALQIKNLTKLTYKDVYLVHAYFSEIYKQFHSEAIVLFHKSPEEANYTVIVPESYSASAAHLTYEHNQPTFCTLCRVCSTQENITNCPRCGTETMVPTKIAGTAHSHGSMSAFHSGVDDAHEKNQTGFHITFGNVNQSLFNICPSFVVAIPGYLDEKGFGKRFYPPVEHLIEIPNPLAQTELALIMTWATVLFDEDKYLSPGVKVVIEENASLPCFKHENEEVLQRWMAAQPISRKLQALTVSELQKRLKSMKNKSSKPGSSTTKNQKEPGLCQDTLNLAGTIHTKLCGNDIKEEELSSSTISLGIGLEETVGEMSVLVETDNTITITIDNTIDNVWDFINSNDSSDLNHGIFITWSTIYAFQEFSNLIDTLVPRKTPGFSTSLDKKFEKLKSELIDTFSSCSTAAENYLDGYIFDKDTPNEASVSDYIQGIVTETDKLITDNQYCFNKENSLSKQVAAYMVLLGRIQTLAEKALDTKIISEDIMDIIDTQINNIVEDCIKEVDKKEQSSDSELTLLPDD